MSRPAHAVIDAIVLAFSRSKLRELVGTDALKMVLSGTTTTRELFPDPGTLSLQPLWDLLESQPGFIPEDATPPLCRIKSWESSLEMTVALPNHLLELDVEAQALRTAECPVGDDELQQILEPPAPPPPPAPAPVPRPRTSEPHAVETVSISGLRVHSGSSRRTMIAVALAVLAIIAVIVSIKLTFGGESKATRLSASEISNEIPLTQIRQKGPVIGAVLADRSWLSKPEAERRQQLATALDNVKALGANDLVVFDSKGTLVASVASHAGKPIVTFAKHR